jgi:cytochrome c oxidase assembly protein subunit 17
MTEATLSVIPEAEVPAPVLKGKSGKKICCSCPDTKEIRDKCVVENGLDKCDTFIEAHKTCLRAEGFTIA